MPPPELHRYCMYNDNYDLGILQNCKVNVKNYTISTVQSERRTKQSYLYAEKWFPTRKFLLTYNDDTLHMYCPWPEKDPYWFWGQRSRSNLYWYLTSVDQDPRRDSIDFGSKGHIRTSNFVLFSHNNSMSFWHTIVIIHFWVNHDTRRTSVAFWVKGQGHIRTRNFVGLLLIFGSKDQGQTLKVWICCHGGYFKQAGRNVQGAYVVDLASA